MQIEMSQQGYKSNGFAHGPPYTDNLTSRAPPAEEEWTPPTIPISSWQPMVEYPEPPLTSGSSAAFSSPGLESNCNPLKDSFKNAKYWHSWNNQEDSGDPALENKQYHPMSSGYADHIPYVPSSILNQTQPAMGTTDDRFGTWENSTTAAFENSTTATYDFAFPETSSAGCANEPTNSKRHRRKASDNASKRSDIMQSPTKVSSSRTRTSKASVTTQGEPERRYRGRMNNEFARLLSALESVAANKPGGLGLSTTGKALSKIEILDLAKKHIVSLERERFELEGEGQTLQAQLDFFKNSYASCGGQPIA